MHISQLEESRKAERRKNSGAILTLALFISLPFGLFSCPGNSKSNNNVSTQPTPAPSPSAQSSSSNVAFDGERAFAHVRKQVEFGPRPPGSPELARTREYIIGELKSYGLNVVLDEFEAQTPIGPVKMVNITAEIPGESSEVIMLTSHYDTKHIREFRFVGANDAGSSTGAVLELARVIAARQEKPHYTYWLTFFDGEEAFCFDWNECKNSGAPDNTYGSRRFVSQLKDRNELKRVRAMILLDMMGYKDLELGRDDMSTPWLVDIVWQTARELGHGAKFVNRKEGVGGDDHEPFVKASIPSLDIIQLSTYEYWHSEDDTLDKVSPQSLQIVGDVLIASLPRIEERLSSTRRN